MVVWDFFHQPHLICLVWWSRFRHLEPAWHRRSTEHSRIAWLHQRRWIYMLYIWYEYEISHYGSIGRMVYLLAFTIHINSSCRYIYHTWIPWAYNICTYIKTNIYIYIYISISTYIYICLYHQKKWNHRTYHKHFLRVMCATTVSHHSISAIFVGTD